MSDQSNLAPKASGAFILSPSASKRLLGMAVAAMPEVQNAYKNGRLVVANGTTTAYVLDALLGQPVRKYNYCIGVIAQSMFAETAKEDRDKLRMWHGGKPHEGPLGEFIREFERDDVFIKGANAVDPYGYAGGLQGNPNGGTWSEVLGVLVARGCHTIVPVGLEKLIPSVVEASRKVGQRKLTFSAGSPVGLMPLVTARVITEVEALKMLAGVDAVPVAGGGIGGNEGAVSLYVEGTQEQVEKAFAVVKVVRDEPLVNLGGKITPLPHRVPEGWE